MKNDLRRSVEKSNRRFGLNQEYYSDARREMKEARAARQARIAHAQYLERVRQEEEDRNRYIIPEFQDLEEQLTG